MSVLEWLLALTTMVVLVAVLRRGTVWRPVAAFGAVGLGIVLVLHGLVDGTRWQLLPLYGLDVGLVVAGGTRLLRPERPARGGRVRALLVGLLAGVLLVTSVALGVILPVPELPAPDGELAVGTTTWVVHTERPEPYGGVGGTRSFPVQAWYPIADGDVGVPDPWVEDAPAFSAPTAGWLGLPPFLLNHLDLVATHATTDAPVRAAPDDAGWPLVVLSHGWGGFRSIQSDLAEQLASHGYVVVAPDHVYGATAARFPRTTGPDGAIVPARVVGIDDAALPAEEDVGAAVYAAAAAQLVATFADDLVATLVDLALAAGDEPPAARLQRADLTTTARAGVVAAAPAWLAAQVDTTRELLAGHSTGGGAAVQACRLLGPASGSRGPEGTSVACAGVLGFDPWVEPVDTIAPATSVPAPVLAIRSGEWVGNANDQVLRRLLAGSSDATATSMPGTVHRDYTLLGYLSPFGDQLQLTGDVPIEAVHAALDAETLAWADRILRGGRMPLPSADPTHPVFADDGLLRG